MKRIFLVFLVLVMLSVSSCKNEEQTSHMMAVSSFSDEMCVEGDKSRALQKKLAAWYNLNLITEDPEPGFRRTYESILYYNGGVMGYLQITDTSPWFPIGHGRYKTGISHDPNSAFPIGGEGNHAILHCEEYVELKPGDRFSIYILGETLTYCVGQEGRDQCTLVCGDMRYDAARVVED